jgi:predicted DNA-binding antitoxin AbrB/MazE fold protein
MYDVISGRTTPQKAIASSFDSFTSNLVPVDLGSSFNSTGKFTGWPFIPTFMVPVWDLIINEDFAGRYIFREPFTKEMEERMSDSQMYKYGTNPFLVKLTNALYEATGGDIDKGMAYYFQDGKKKHAWGSVNPSSVEHLLEGYLSGKGQFYNQTYKLISRVVKPSPEDKTIQTYDIPVVSRFVRSAWGDPIKDEYYQKSKAASDIIYEFKQGKKVSMQEGNRVKQEIGIQKFNQAEKINNLQKKIDDVNEDLNSPKLSQARKDQLMTRKRSLMKQINALEL